MSRENELKARIKFYQKLMRIYPFASAFYFALATASTAQLNVRQCVDAATK